MDGIATTYDAARFRSRLEARWAALFDLLRWPWIYEPVDLAGYIPDFVLNFHRPLLVEVKPAFAVPELIAAAAAKVEASRWEHEALIVGVTPVLVSAYGPWAMAGAGPFGAISDRSAGPGWEWDAACPCICLVCGRASLHHESNGWSCRVCGAAQGGGNAHIEAPPDLGLLWNEAGSRVQWLPKESA